VHGGLAGVVDRGERLREMARESCRRRAHVPILRSSTARFACELSRVKTQRYDFIASNVVSNIRSRPS
jgi:hypothetical protein